MIQTNAEKNHPKVLSLIFRKITKIYSHPKKNFVTQREKCIFEVGKKVSQQNAKANIILIIKKKINNNNLLKKQKNEHSRKFKVYPG